MRGARAQALRGGGMCVEAPDTVLVFETSVTGNTAGVDGGGVLMVSVLTGTADFVRSPVRNNTVRRHYVLHVGGCWFWSAVRSACPTSTASCSTASCSATKRHLFARLSCSLLMT